MSNNEDTIAIEFELDAVQKDKPYAEVSMFDFIPDNDTLQLVLDPFEVYPRERMLDLMRIVEQRRNESGASHEDWLADDLGEGYDRDDPFIDDSEAPQEILGIATKFGGFYVSKGDVEIVNEKLATVEEPEDPTLPQQISPALREKLEAFVSYYQDVNNKEDVWSDKAALDLLKAINDGLFNLSSTLRGRILSYLSHRLKVKKAYLLKKLRKIRNASVAKTMDRAIMDLRQYVEATMPQQMHNWFLTAARWDSSDQKQNGGMPRKTFLWSPEGKKLLQEVVKLRLEQMTSSESVLETLQSFLEKIVKPIWPKGWVTVNGLIKECLPVLPPKTAVISSKKRKLPPAVEPQKPKFSMPVVTAFPVGTMFADPTAPQHHLHPDMNRDGVTLFDLALMGGKGRYYDGP